MQIADTGRVIHRAVGRRMADDGRRSDEATADDGRWATISKKPSAISAVEL